MTREKKSVMPAPKFLGEKAPPSLRAVHTPSGCRCAVFEQHLQCLQQSSINGATHTNTCNKSACSSAPAMVPREYRVFWCVRVVACARVCWCVCVRGGARVSVCAGMCECVRGGARTWHTYTHTQTQTHRHTDTDVHRHTHTHTHLHCQLASVQGTLDGA